MLTIKIHISDISQKKVNTVGVEMTTYIKQIHYYFLLFFFNIFQ